MIERERGNEFEKRFLGGRNVRQTNDERETAKKHTVSVCEREREREKERESEREREREREREMNKNLTFILIKIGKVLLVD